MQGGICPAPKELFLTGKPNICLMEKRIVALGNGSDFAGKLARNSGLRKVSYHVERFPDNELHMRFKESVRGKQLFLVQSLSLQPNDALIELVFAGRTAKELGAKKVVGIIPYLAYMRQDKRFKGGECISAKEMAWMLNNSLDALITIDPHLHRIRKLNQIFRIPAKNVSSVDAISGYVEKKFDAHNTLIVGPDWESFQWARTVGKKAGMKSVIFLKQRFSSRRVKVHYKKDVGFSGKNIIIIDDIISTGHTMIEAVKEIRKKKPKAIYCVCVHGILAENALQKLKRAGAKQVISCNTVPGITNKIDVSRAVAEEIK